MNAIIAQIKQALLQPLPGLEAQLRMVGRVRLMPSVIPENSRQSAVLCLLFDTADGLNVLLMKRGEDKSAHSGQVSFPGGRYEEADKDYLNTALRECHEEVGINGTDVCVLGALTPLYIPVSNFNVHPFVGFIPGRPSYKLSKNEVAYTLEVPLNVLYAPERKIVTDVISPAKNEPIRNVHAYQLPDGTIIWGATAMMLSELEAVLNNNSIPY